MESKRCPLCDVTKPVDAFHLWTHRDGRQVYCKSCRKAYDADYHRRTWGERRRRQKQHRQREFAAWARSLKAGRPCADCGGHYPPEALQWDHLPGAQKTANVSDLVRRGSRARVLEEIEKCELVCANCHAARTVRRLGA
jgi:hypothetical protein